MSSRAATMPVEKAGVLRRLFPTFAVLCGNLGWPILLRQLRSDFRKNRFFLSQFVCLAVLGAVLIGMITTYGSDGSKTALQIGQALFNSFFVIQFLIILVIFPAFSSTAFSEERAGLTMDLLITSTLKAEEVVWGKFLASTVYCLVYVVASIPLLSISFLFGGVEMREVLIAYAILIGLTLLVSMLGTCISSCYTSNIRATLTVYVIVFAALGASWYVYDQVAPLTKGSSSRTLVGALLEWSGPGYSLSTAHVAVALLVAFAYLFLITANRVRPAADDKSSLLRMLTFGTIVLLVATSIASRLGWTGSGFSLVAAPTATKRAEWFKDLIQQAAMLLFLVAVTFPTEEAVVSRRVRARFARKRGMQAVLRLFSPGALWGFVYSAVLTGIVCGGLALAWQAWFAPFASKALDFVVTQSLTILPLYVLALAALGFLLAACDFTPLYSRLTLAFIVVISVLLPMIFLFSKEKDAPSTDWTVLARGYYLSPVTLWASLNADPSDDKAQYYLFGVHVADVAKVLFGFLAIAFLSAGLVLLKRNGVRHQLPVRKLVSDTK